MRPRNSSKTAQAKVRAEAITRPQLEQQIVNLDKQNRRLESQNLDLRKNLAAEMEGNKRLRERIYELEHVISEFPSGEKIELLTEAVVQMYGEIKRVKEEKR